MCLGGFFPFFVCVLVECSFFPCGCSFFAAGMISDTDTFPALLFLL